MKPKYNVGDLVRFEIINEYTYPGPFIVSDIAFGKGVSLEINQIRYKLVSVCDQFELDWIGESLLKVYNTQLFYNSTTSNSKLYSKVNELSEEIRKLKEDLKHHVHPTF